MTRRCRGEAALQALPVLVSDMSEALRIAACVSDHLRASPKGRLRAEPGLAGIAPLRQHPATYASRLALHGLACMSSPAATRSGSHATS